MSTIIISSMLIAAIFIDIFIIFNFGKGEKCIQFIAYIHKCCLHSGKNIFNFAFVNIANHPVFILFFNINFNQLAIFLDRNTGFTHTLIYKDFLLHICTYMLHNARLFIAKLTQGVFLSLPTRLSVFFFYWGLRRKENFGPEKGDKNRVNCVRKK